MAFAPPVLADEYKLGAQRLNFQLKEMNLMNAKDKGETTDQALVIEDLSAENAEEIKGGDGQAISKMSRIGYTSAAGN